MSQYGNCPYCGSPICKLGLSDFLGKSKNKSIEKTDNPLSKLSERDDFKQHMERH